VRFYLVFARLGRSVLASVRLVLIIVVLALHFDRLSVRSDDLHLQFALASRKGVDRKLTVNSANDAASLNAGAVHSYTIRIATTRQRSSFLQKSEKGFKVERIRKRTMLFAWRTKDGTGGRTLSLAIGN
jgi:hypothetical protein